MDDVYEELVGNGTDPGQLAAALRKQKQLGMVAGLTGIAGLQKAGPSMVSSADQQAEFIAGARQSAKDRALQRALAAQNAALASQDRADARADATARHNDTMGLRRSIAAANATRQAGNSAQAKADVARAAKEPALMAAKDALMKLADLSPKVGTLSYGPMLGKAPAFFADAQNFDAARAMLEATIQAALRVPGIGSQSDAELKSLQRGLPSRDTDPKVRQMVLAQMARRLDIVAGRELSPYKPPGGGTPDGDFDAAMAEYGVE